jgi:uncharacterized protein with HEPN domain
MSARLGDIRHALGRIDVALGVQKEAEQRSDGRLADVAYDAILYRLLVIGEAVKNLDSEYTERHAEVPWRQIARLRDVLAHHYYRVDSSIVDLTVTRPLQVLGEVVGSVTDPPS